MAAMSIPRLYRLAQRTIVTAADAACWEIIAPPSEKVRVLELRLAQVTAVAGVYGVGISATKGVTPTTPVVFSPDKFSLADPLTAGAVGWVTPPIVPAKFKARIACPATIGAGFDLQFGDGRENGIEIPAGRSLVIWVLATAPVCDVTALIEEQA